MSVEQPCDAFGAAEQFFSRLELAWNAADGQRYGAEFCDIADFVTVRGEHLHGGPALIGAGHQRIFDTIYRGSTNRIRASRARAIAPGCVLVHGTANLSVPTGPLVGAHDARMTALLVERGGDWKATAFHNTLITG